MNGEELIRDDLDRGVAEYLRSLVGAARRILGADLIAAYAAGSIGLVETP